MIHYTRAPITEALIDLQFAGPAVSADDLAPLQEQTGGLYPEKHPIVFASVTVDGSPPGDPLPTFTGQPASQVGWAFVAADQRRVWQVRPGAFTFSRLAPYETWDAFRNEARRLWAITRSVCRPESFTRIGVRYINRLDLPLPVDDFKHYLKTVPEISDALPQSLSGYFMQLQVPLADIKGMLVLNQQLLPQVRQGDQTRLPVLLDIDVSRSSDLPTVDAGPWELLELLHLGKNQIFEGCITDRVRDLIR